MIHTIFQGLLFLYKFLFTLVILQWDILFVDFYVIGTFNEWYMKKRTVIGFLFGWMVSSFFSLQCVEEIPSMTEVSLPGFFLDMIIVMGMSLTYDRIKTTYKEFLLEPRIGILKLFCHISLFTMIFSYLKIVFY